MKVVGIWCISERLINPSDTPYFEDHLCHELGRVAAGKSLWVMNEMHMKEVIMEEKKKSRRRGEMKESIKLFFDRRDPLKKGQQKHFSQWSFLDVNELRGLVLLQLKLLTLEI